MNRLVAAAFALAASCGTAIAGISFEEEIPAFRQGVDDVNINCVENHGIHGTHGMTT